MVTWRYVVAPQISQEDKTNGCRPENREHPACMMTVTAFFHEADLNMETAQSTAFRPG